MDSESEQYSDYVQISIAC